VPPSQLTGLRDAEWATQTCPLTFASVGVWPEAPDGSDLRACAASNSAKLLATGDDFGKIKLYAYPASQTKVQ